MLTEKSNKFNSPYDPKKTEPEIYKRWEKSGFFNPDNLKIAADAKSYTIVLPPPNVTGSLHLGHALNATIQDILIRRGRMQGYRALWLPGTDHAGIATQNAVEKMLKKEGVSRHDLGKEKFIEKIWEWKEKYGNIILDQLKTLGASCDWSRTTFTMDENYKEAVSAAFKHYYEKGLIYQGERVINWCPRCATSLSDLELEYEEEKGKLYYIKYPLAENPKSEIRNPKQIPKFKSQIPKYITVATTRPETMLGDTAVAVNPKDERYKGLVGRTVILPIQEREIPIVADDAVDPEFGTGAVKVTPAHSIADFEIAERHKLPFEKIIDERGKMTTASKICEGLNTADCRGKVVAELEKLDLLEKVEDFAHNVSHCYRCGKVIEQMLSKQWFVKMDTLAKKAIEAVRSGKIKIHPKNFEKIYFDWLENTRDWCISRQIWWGHQLPVFYCSKKLEKFKIQNSKFKINEEYFIVSKEKPKKCPICNNCEMKQSEDVLDTWFSSALWPFATLGWPIACAQNQKSKIKNQNYCVPQSGTNLDKFYPTQVLSTARDIINLWVARMIFSGLEFMGEIPFSDVYVHPTILTRDGKRMSKSLGTGIDPLVLVEKYGTDAARFGLIWQNMGGQDIHFSEEHMLAGKKFCNKLWNISRFVLTRNGNPNFQITNYKQIQNSKLQTEDKEILEKLNETTKLTNEYIDTFQFGQALHTIYDFVWHEFADKYIEYSKTKDADDIKQVLAYTLANILKLLHPFMPFVTEEIWESLPIENKKMLMIERWPDV